MGQFVEADLNAIAVLPNELIEFGVKMVEIRAKCFCEAFGERGERLPLEGVDDWEVDGD